MIYLLHKQHSYSLTYLSIAPKRTQSHIKIMLLRAKYQNLTSSPSRLNNMQISALSRSSVSKPFPYALAVLRRSHKLFESKSFSFFFR